MTSNETYPLVSILVPVYNVETYINHCARSALEQTYDQLEFVFIDDGCSDASITVLKNVIDKYPCRKERCTIIHHQRNRGLAASRNTAVYSCHGDFVFHVDADDWIEPNAISDLVKRQQETDADIVYTSSYYKYNKEDVIIDCHGWSSDKKALLLNILQDKATICVWSKLIRKTLYTDNDIWCDERGSFYEDFQVLPRLVYYSNIIECLDKCIYHYNRSNPKSLVTNLSRNIEIQKQGLLSIQTILDFFHDKEHYYLDLVKRFYLCYTYKMLNANFRHKNRKGYFDFLRLLNQTDRQYWDQIGWNKPWRRLNDHYNYLRLFIQ